MSKQSFPYLVGGLLLSLALTGCTTSSRTTVAMVTAPTAQVPVAAKAPAKANLAVFTERAEVPGGALKLTATPLKLNGPANFTVEVEGDLKPFEIQGIMTTMGHGFDQPLKADGDHFTASDRWEMDGRWLIRVKAQDKTGEIQTAIFYVDVAPQ